jgi:hypothetical protein
MPVLLQIQQFQEPAIQKAMMAIKGFSGWNNDCVRKSGGRGLTKKRKGSAKRFMDVKLWADLLIQSHCEWLQWITPGTMARLEESSANVLDCLSKYTSSNDRVVSCWIDAQKKIEN